MQKPKILIDLDGCVYPFDHAARTVLRLHGHDIKLGEHNSTEWMALPNEAGTELMDELWSTHRREVFEAAPPYPGAVKALHRIEQLARIMFVTHRPVDVAHITLRWLANMRVNPHAVIHASGEPKSTYVGDGCIACVEDKNENVLELAANTDEIPIFVPVRPWNTRVVSASGLGSWIVPFKDWSFVADGMEELCRS